MTLVRWASARDADLSVVVRQGTSDERAAREVLDKNAYERPRLGFTLTSGDRWLDAGANIGAFTALACHRGASLVVAVEPLPAHLALLYQNTEGLAVTIVEGVVAAVPGRATLGVRPEDTQWRSSILADHRDLTTIEVQAYDLPSLVAAFDLTAVKLDIEGAELDILDTWLPPPQITKVVWEWSFDIDPVIDRLRRVLTRMEALGFKTSTHSAVSLRNNERWEWYPAGLMCWAWR